MVVAAGPRLKPTAVDDDVDDDAECVELVFLAFTVTLPQFATFAVEDGAGQGMATFSPVKLDQRGATFGLIVEVRQRVDCLVDPWTGDPVDSVRRKTRKLLILQGVTVYF